MSSPRRTADPTNPDDDDDGRAVARTARVRRARPLLRRRARARAATALRRRRTDGDRSERQRKFGRSGTGSANSFKLLDEQMRTVSTDKKMIASMLDKLNIQVKVRASVVGGRGWSVIVVPIVARVSLCLPGLARHVQYPSSLLQWPRCVIELCT